MRLAGEFARDLILLPFVAPFAGNGGDRRSSILLASCCCSAGTLQSERAPCPVDAARSSICIGADEI